MDVYSQTHRGLVRSENQDHVYLSGRNKPCYAIVADGMGGHVGGQVASAKAVSFVCEQLKGRELRGLGEQDIKKLVEGAGSEVLEAANRSEALKDMGTTFTMAYLSEEEIIIGHVGDTRAYLQRNGTFEQITKDHSYVQLLVDRGILSKEEAIEHPYKNLITRALGMEEVEVDIVTCSFGGGDSLLICSDGLSGCVADAEISEVLSGTASAKEKVEALIELALERGGQDNISAVLIIDDGGQQDG